MSSGEFYLKTDVYAHDVVDDIRDILDQAEGKHTAQNKQGDTCGGGRPIGECDSVRQLTREIIIKAQTVEPNPLDATHPKLFKTGEQVKADIACDECQMLCHGAARVIDNAPTERIRYMFEDPNTTVDTSQAQEVVTSQQPVIPTSFEGEYYKIQLTPEELL